MLFGASKYDGQFGCLYEIVYLHLNNYFDFHVCLSFRRCVRPSAVRLSEK